MRARISQTKIQKSKTAAHCLQSLLIFVAGCITIAIFTKDGTTDGRTAYFFALCFVTVPAILYLACVPMWARTVRFANAYAFAVIDILYTIFWFAAFICIATWNSEGIKQGAKDQDLDESDGNCSTFAYGSELKCNLSKATVGFGVIICLLFVLTSVISVYYVRKYRETGTIPGVKEPSSGNYNNVLDPTYTETAGAPGKEDPESAWSANTAELEHDHLHDTHDPHNPYGPDSYNAPYATSAYSASNYDRADTATLTSERKYAPLHAGEAEPHEGRRMSWGDDRFGTDHPAYRGSERVGEESNAFHFAPSALTGSSYEEYRPKNYNFGS